MKSASQFNLQFLLGVIGLKLWPRGIQASLHTLIKVPLPTRQIIPCFTNASPCMIPFHTAEELEGKTVSNKFPRAKYLAQSNRAHKLSGVSSSRHACLASNARLKQWISINPMPPMFLCIHIFHHGNQCIFFCETSSPHQKPDISSLIALHIPLGSLKTDIA